MIVNAFEIIAKARILFKNHPTSGCFKPTAQAPEILQMLFNRYFDRIEEEKHKMIEVLGPIARI